jgi:hypothetical protein
MSDKMTRKDREELCKVVRLRAKVARADAARCKSELLAALEAQLSAVFDAHDEAWAAIHQEAADFVREADARIAAVCRQRGVPENFRPGLHLSWYHRGENADRERRAELRKLGQQQAEAAESSAKLAITSREAEILTELHAGNLESDEARRFLEALPTAASLMPPLVLGDLQKLLEVETETEVTIDD